MSVVRFNVAAELRKFLRNKPTKASREVLLELIAEDYLARSK